MKFPSLRRHPHPMLTESFSHIREFIWKPFVTIHVALKHTAHHVSTLYTVRGMYTFKACMGDWAKGSINPSFRSVWPLVCFHLSIRGHYEKEPGFSVVPFLFGKTDKLSTHTQLPALKCRRQREGIRIPLTRLSLNDHYLYHSQHSAPFLADWDLWRMQRNTPAAVPSHWERERERERGEFHEHTFSFLFYSKYTLISVRYKTSRLIR